MYSAMANRKWLAPSGTNRSRHSILIESTNRAAKAIRFGLCAGNLTVLTPAWSRMRRNACVYNGSRSSSRYRLPSSARAYARHCPETTLLYRTIQEHWATFLADLESGGGELPAFVLDEFESYLRCGIPAQVFCASDAKSAGIVES